VKIKIKLFSTVYLKLKRYFERKFEDKHLAELVKSSSTAFSFRVIGIGFSYIFTLLITRGYGAKAMGIFALSLTVLQVSSVIGRLGMDTALLRFVAEYSSQGKWCLIKEISKKALKLVIFFSVFVSLIVFFYSSYIAQHIFHKGYLSIYFKIISIGIVPFVLYFINSERLRGLKKIKEYSFLKYMGLNLFASILLFVSFFFIKKFYVPIVVYVISIFIMLVFSVFFWIKKFAKYKNVANYKNKIKTISYKNILSVSIPMFLTSSLALIMGWTDIFMLGMLKSTTEVGIYRVAFRVATMISIALLSVNSIAAPKFAEFWAKKDMKGFERIARQSTKLIFWTSFPILLVFLLFPSSILGIFGNEFKKGVFVLLILTFGQFINAVVGSVGYILQMTGKEKILQYVVFIAVLVNIGLNIVLIPKYGINGAAFASMFSLAIINIIPFFLVKKYYGFYTINFKGLKKA
jgi:O-antigen/teichoic acid export membrane protein